LTALAVKAGEILMRRLTRKRPTASGWPLDFLLWNSVVERKGIEPSTSALRTQRSPS